MLDFITDMAFDPLIGSFGLGVCLFAIAAVTVLSALTRMKSAVWRLLGGLLIMFALLNPQTVEEEREPLTDTVLVLKDESESMRLGQRAEQSDRLYAGLLEQLEADTSLEVITARVPSSEGGTRLISSLIENLGQVPRTRLAGVIALSDGQVHDMPERIETLLPDNVPFHSFIVSDETARDRRVRAIVAPRFGLVGDLAEFEILIDDPGYEAERAIVEVLLDGELKARFSSPIGTPVTFPLEIERRGLNTVEIRVESVPGELTLNNNLFVAEISGIRDRMRVLLVTGAPHQGGRAWRNLLKSDPAVDLVHFTILTNPAVKFTNARQNELSLIQFPTRQLFEDKLSEFDMIIFDQFARRQAPGRSGRVTPLLQPYYIQNIAEYVEDGGALLVTTGPAYAGDNSLFRSPLAAVLPARPTGDVIEYAFKPELNDKGARHPITASFGQQSAQSWGEWFRVIETNVVSGDVLMKGPGNEPLLVIEDVGEGRVGMILSDQSWLWSRGHDGGGPYNELFRRLSHWLLGEPDLDAETLNAYVEQEALVIERRSLSNEAQNVRITNPDGTFDTIEMEQVEPGLFRATAPTAGLGAYKLEAGDVSRVVAVGALNPKEFADLLPTDEILSPLSLLTGGQVAALAALEDIPSMRRVRPGANTQSEGWYGLVRHEAYVTRASRRAPLWPGWIYVLLAGLSFAIGWWREGR